MSSSTQPVVGTVVVAVLLALHLGSVGVPGPSRPATASAAGAAPAPGGGSLDPAPFRGEIEAIEGVLYMPSPPELGDPERVARLAMELAARMQAELGHLAGQRAFIALMGFAAEVEAQGEMGYAAPQLVAPRRDWETLRAELFRAAPWFRRGGAQLVASQQKPEPRADPAVLASLRAWADELGSLAAEGRAEMMEFGEMYVDVREGSREEHALAAGWNEFARGWDARVSGACRQAPGQPSFDGEMNVVMAWQTLGQAAHQLRIATVSPAEWSVPDKAWREESLAQAEARIAEARGWLEKARR